MTIAPAILAQLRFALEPDLSAEAFIGVLETSGLAERRPVAERERVETMLRHADIIVTARHAGNGRLIGVSRAITDYGFCCYLSDLAVDRAFQRRGIGRTLIDRTWDAAGRQTTLILLSAPAAVAYYPHIGMTKHDACFTFPRER
jgi:ribosomal protein S18 acetylase RimI-like enzyme